VTIVYGRKKLIHSVIYEIRLWPDSKKGRNAATVRPQMRLSSPFIGKLPKKQSIVRAHSEKLRIFSGAKALALRERVPL
jgi:hypothetical protein